MPRSTKTVIVTSLILTTKFLFICTRKKLQTYRTIMPERPLPARCRSKISTFRPRHRKHTRKITRIIMVFIIKCHLSSRHLSIFYSKLPHLYPIIFLCTLYAGKIIFRTNNVLICINMEVPAYTINNYHNVDI